MLLQNKTVLIVGGTSGIGRSLVETAANEGACVAFTGRNVQKGCELVEALRAKKQVVDFWKMDVQNIESSCSAVDDILNRYGKLDCLFYNAGVTMPTNLIEEATLEQWDAVVNTNMRAAFFLFQKVLPALKGTKGSACFTSSGAAVSCTGGDVVYAATKAGMNQMIRVLAMKVGSYGVRVNGVAPGPTKTDILENTSQNIIETLKAKTCMNVILDPQDIANAAVFLASDKARHITGTILAVDAGSALR